MSSNTTLSLSPHLSGVDVPAASFGSSYGYRIEGDAVHLNASLVAARPLDDRRDVQLQLWACPAAPQRVDELARGHRVAAANLPPLSEIANEHEPFGVWAPAHPPAGTSEWVMALALVTPAGEAAQGGQVHAFVVFPRPERFLLPRLRGVVGFRLAEDARSVTVWANLIENPRDVANLSGSLALELWALPEPYRGTEFAGVPVAGAALGVLQGGQIWSNVECTLACEPLPPGQWNLVLMLREWAGAGYETRDFANFPLPYEVAPEAPPAAPEVPPTPAAMPEEFTTATKEAAPSPQVESEQPVQTEVPETDGGDLVSVNTADAAGLKSVKGITAPVARAIVEGRPFATLDQLRKVKGIGPKTFAKIRRWLRL